jgi:hypothetical protein
MSCATYHTNPIHLTEPQQFPLVSEKKKLERIQMAEQEQLFECLQEI